LNSSPIATSVYRWLLLFAIIIVVLALDQITKEVVLTNMLLGESIQPIPAISRFFQFTYSQNTGSAFGFLPQAGNFFLIIAVVVVTVMLFYYPRIPDGMTISRLAVGLICGGALGNAIDRIRHEAVIDFIHYQIPGVISNVSNLADHAIVLGVLLIFIDSWRMDRQKSRLQSEMAESP
jgi:signal peptidase II